MDLPPSQFANSLARNPIELARAFPFIVNDNLHQAFIETFKILKIIVAIPIAIPGAF